MITDNNYLDAWIIYWVGAALLILVGWRISRGWVAWLKYPLLLAFSAFVLVPFTIQADTTHLGPAWLIMMFEGVFQPDIGFARVGPTLGVAAGVAVLLFPVLAGLVWAVKRIMGGSSSKDQPPAQSH